MKDSLKIALGILIGIIAVLVCLVCGFVVVSMGGLAAITSSAMQTATAENRLAPQSAPTNTVTAIPPTPEPTPIVPIAIGEWVQWNGLRLSVTSYEVSQTCPGGSGQPAAGAKFVIAQVAMLNSSTDVITLPNLQVNLNDYPSSLGTSSDCLYNAEARGNACWQWSGQLYPDVLCFGWELFEVPADMSLQGAVIRIEEEKPEPIHVSEWRLEGD